MITTVELPYPVPVDPLFEQLRALGEPCLLDSCQPAAVKRFGRYDLISAAPEKLIRMTPQGLSVRCMGLWSSVSTDPFEYLEQLVNQLDGSTSELPFTGGLIGHWSYDLGRVVERLPSEARSDIDFPWMQVGLYLWAFVIDHEEQRSYLVAQPGCSDRLIKQLSTLFKTVASDPTPARTITQHFRLIDGWSADQNYTEYAHALNKIDQYIRSGDCYQVNYAQRFQAQFEGDPWRAYLALRDQAPTPFAAYLEYSEGAILSLSPERFLQLSEHRCVETRPIKGTRPRGKDPETDQSEAEQLINSEKDRSENLMIVDLLRNDLSRSCIPGSVKVPELFSIETYPNVHHLVSSVTGQLAEGQTALRLLRNAFPGGSITGAPKIRAMEIIDELEPTRRSVYCGSIGYISASGRMDTSITIRTLLCVQNKIYCWAGGGIVAESDSQAEYQESLNKVNNLLNTLSEQTVNRDKAN